MRKYQPEILLGLILCLTLMVLTPPGSALSAADLTQVPSAAVRYVAARTASESGDRARRIRLAHGDEVRILSLREYLIGVVMSEMPMSFAPEALRAQAVASRTYALHCRKHADADVCDDSCCCQCRQSEQDLRLRFGADYDALRQKAEQAVDSTDGMVLTYRGALIDATFFACSGGRTEDAREVWGAEVPYLRPVASPGEEDARSFYSRAVFPPEAFAATVRTLAPEAATEGDPAGWIGAGERTAGDGVKTVEIGGAVLTGTQLRAAFGLRSTNFALSYDGEDFCFDVYGAGHRVGMSQYGAQAMALAGATAERILTTYYTGVEISHI